jgi:hypothetical protein
MWGDTSPDHNPSATTLRLLLEVIFMTKPMLFVRIVVLSAERLDPVNAAFIREHDLFPLVQSPVNVLPGKLLPGSDMLLRQSRRLRLAPRRKTLCLKIVDDCALTHRAFIH